MTLASTLMKAAEDELVQQQIRVEQEQWILRRTQFLRQDQLERLEKLKAEAEYLDGLVRCERACLCARVIDSSL